MYFPQSKAALLALALSTQLVASQTTPDLAEGSNIARCPTDETSTVVGSNTYKTCANTDIRGASTQMIANVASAAACAQQCAASDGGCAHAVYDTQERVCHIKAEATTNTLIWYTNQRYDVIRREVVRDPATQGSWSDLVRLPVIPVAAYVVPAYPEASRLLMFASWGTDAFGGAGGMTQFVDFDYKT